MTEAEEAGRIDGRGLRFLLPRLALRGGVGSRLGFRAGESLEFQDPVIEVFRDRSASMETPSAKSACADWLFGLLSTAADGCRVVYREHPKTPRAVRVYITDTLYDEDPDSILVRLAHNSAALAVVRVLSREEADPPAAGAFELIDSETGERREMTMDSDTLSKYRAALDAHTARWTAAANRLGATFVDLAAEAPRPERISSLAAASLVEGRG